MRRRVERLPRRRPADGLRIGDRRVRRQRKRGLEVGLSPDRPADEARDLGAREEHLAGLVEDQDRLACGTPDRWRSGRSIGGTGWTWHRRGAYAAPQPPQSDGEVYRRLQRCRNMMGGEAAR